MQITDSKNEPELKCVRNGCKKKYLESENNEKACHHHPGKPIFHDLKKGWTCCNQIVYDWDEFQNLRPCAVDRHSNIEVNKPENQSEFYKSNTVSNAQKALDKEQVVIKSIDDFNKQEDEKKKLQQMNNPIVEQKIFYNEKIYANALTRGAGLSSMKRKTMKVHAIIIQGIPFFMILKNIGAAAIKRPMIGMNL